MKTKLKRLSAWYLALTSRTPLDAFILGVVIGLNIGMTATCVALVFIWIVVDGLSKI